MPSSRYARDAYWRWFARRKQARRSDVVPAARLRVRDDLADLDALESHEAARRLSLGRRRARRLLGLEHNHRSPAAPSSPTQLSWRPGDLRDDLLPQRGRGCIGGVDCHVQNDCVHRALL